MTTTERDVSEEEGEQPLGRAVTKALGWSTLAELLGRVGNLGVGIVLARLLTTEDFGVYATVLVAVNILMVVNDLGVIAAVIRWQGDVKEAANTAATLSMISSAILFALACVTAGPFAAALGSPDATNLVRVVAIVILLDGISGAHLGVLVRTFRNDKIALSELSGFVVGTPVIVALAFLDFGPWSIVIGRVLGAVAVSIVLMRSVPFKIRPNWDKARAIVLLRFGAPLALSAVVAQGVLNVDYVVVGRSLGAVELGIYLLAFNLSSWPTSLVSTAVARVSFAGMSRLVEDKSRLFAAFPRSIGVAMSVLVPLVVVLEVLAPEVIRFLYGNKWEAAATPLRFLVLLGGLRIVIDLLMDLTIADGRPTTSLKIRTVWLIALIGALAAGAHLDGLRGVGIAHVMVAVLIIVPWLLVDARRSGVKAVWLGRQVVRPALAGLLSAAAMLAVLAVLHGDLLRLFVGGAVGGLVYLAALLPRNPLVAWALTQVRPSRTATP